MAPLTTAARAIARSTSSTSTTARTAAAAVRCLSSTPARADATYQSPFKGEPSTTRVPDFSHYASKASPNKNLVYSYFMVGAMGAVTAMGAKSTIQGEPTTTIKTAWEGETGIQRCHVA